MRIEVRVIPRARQRNIEKNADGSLLVKVTEPAEDGRANAAVIEAVAEYLGVAKRRVTLIRGRTSRRKLLEVSPER